MGREDREDLLTLVPKGDQEGEGDGEGHSRVTVRRPRKVIEARDPAAMPSRSDRSAQAGGQPDEEPSQADDQRAAKSRKSSARSTDIDGDTNAGGSPRPRGRASDINEQVRRLSMTEQVRMAKRGNQMERAALERRYGKTVWEALLRNPRITQPEVARIARKGTVPRKLLEIVCDTPGWLTSPQIRRALLSNRKLTRDMVSKVLRAMPMNELRLVPKQRAYPPIVRKTAEKMLGIQ